MKKVVNDVKTTEDECIPIDSDDELFDIKPSSFRDKVNEEDTNAWKHEAYNKEPPVSNGVIFGGVKG